MARKKKAAKRTRSKRKAARKKLAAITVRRSSGRKEKFDLERMASTTSRSGVPFLMARDVAKKVSKEIKSEARGKGKKTLTAGRVRKMIAGELRARNEKGIASSYTGGAPENAGNVEDRYKPPVGSADTDQHGAYRADRDSVLHDRSKRLASAA